LTVNDRERKDGATGRMVESLGAVEGVKAPYAKNRVTQCAISTRQFFLLTEAGKGLTPL
jgi:hypothetical protein